MKHHKVQSALDAFHRAKLRIAAGVFVMTALTLMLFLGLSVAVALLQAGSKGQLFSPRNADPHAFLEFSGDQIRTNELSEMTIRILERDGSPYTGIIPSEGKYMHVFVTDNDLIMYGHDHPDDYLDLLGPNSESVRTGVFKMPILFPKAGSYSVAVKFTIKNGTYVTNLFSVSVADTNGTIPVSHTLPRTDARYSKNFGDYLVTFNPVPHAIFTCSPAQLEFSIEKSGKPVTELENYDNAPLTIAGWDTGLDTFITARANPLSAFKSNAKLTASALFVKPGLYRLFAEFKHQGTVIPASFALNVQGSDCIAPLQ